MTPAKKAAPKKKEKVNPSVRAIYERTVEWGKDYGIYPKESDNKKGLSKKAKKVSKALDKMDLGCRDKGVRELMSVLLDEKIPSTKGSTDSMSFKPGLALIPKSRAAMEGNADVGVPYIIIDNNGKAITCSDGESETITLGRNSAEHLEVADIVEIDGLLKELKSIKGHGWLDVVFSLLGS